MTENDVIQGLECCMSNATGNEYCKDCPYNIYEYCGEETSKDALALINRQKAKIEKLNTIIDDMLVANRLRIDIAHRDKQEAKFEAYKEIVGKLKEHLCSYDLPDYHSFRAVDEDTIDEVLKELVGESA